ncbi:hypothetical protein GEMRC1_012819 [Eukaryota sp. GEM-RC1]
MQLLMSLSDFQDRVISFKRIETGIGTLTPTEVSKFNVVRALVLHGVEVIQERVLGGLGVRAPPRRPTWVRYNFRDLMHTDVVPIPLTVGEKKRLEVAKGEVSEWKGVLRGN